MLMLDDLEELKRKVAELRRRRDEAVGRAKQIAERVRAEFGVKTIAEGKKRLAAEQKKERVYARRYTSMMKKVKSKYRKELGDAEV